ncbi:MAG: baseplate J/gp47 family protein [Ruminococcus sp.]|nr:baseplate J/gp47 family protein [Ruminococcus sp.]
MKENYTQQRGEDFDEAGDIAIRLKVLAGEIYNMQTTVEWLKRQLFPSTATGEFLDRFAAQRGLARNPAAKAHGRLKFSVNEQKTTAVTIPRGTVVSTDSEIPVRIYTTEDSEIPPYTYSVTVPAEAEQAGYRGNVNARTAVVPVSVPSEVDAITNESPFTGGFDEESDTTLRARIQNSYVNSPNGMNASFYIELVKQVDGITKAGVVSRARGAGTINIYIADTDGNATDAQLNEAQAIVNAQRELNVDALVTRATSLSYDLSVLVTKKAGYSSAEVISMCADAFEDYVSTIPIGGRLYLSVLGKYLLETGCIDNYEFDPSMSDMSVPNSKFFVTGDVNVEVS